MQVLKFGGSSVRNAECIDKLRDIISNVEKTIIIFSAFGDTTERLIKQAEIVVQTGFYNPDQIEPIFWELANKLSELTGNRMNKNYVSKIINDLSKQYYGISYLKELYPKTLDYILSFGEIITNKLIHEYFTNTIQNKNIVYLDSRDVIKTNSNYQNAMPLDITSNIIRETINNIEYDILIMPGFIGKDIDGNTTTLGRGGGDFTASIIGSALKANVIKIYSDADGILTANPKIVNNAQLIKSLTYHHAYEISYYGGKILYHRTLKPAYLANVPIIIKNTFNDASPGSLISNNVCASNKVLAITNLDDLTLFKIRGLDFKESIGISQKLFATISRVGANIYFISQSSSETCIYFCVKDDMADEVKKAICKKFPSPDVTLDRYNNKSIIAIIINNRGSSAFVMQQFFKQFYDRIDFDLINQSDLSINFIVNKENVLKYMNILHNYFIMGNKLTNTLNLQSHIVDTDPVQVYIYGYGNIGKKLAEYLSKDNNMILCGIANSKKMLFDTDFDMSVQSTYKLIECLNNGENINTDAFVNYIIDKHNGNSCFIDCTASTEITKYYTKLLSNSVKIVTPNKKAFSENIELYNNIKPYFGKKILFETVCGSRLPIVDTIRKLVNSGNNILSIEGIFSGSINYIMTEFMNDDLPISDIIVDAHFNGYTEPNPNDDLSGMDVARKILILSRLCGESKELKDIKIENLADPVDGSTTESFMENIGLLDKKFEELKDLCKDPFSKEPAAKLKYIAEYNSVKGTLETNLKFCYPDSPFFNVDGTNNIVVIKTDRSKEPIIISGAGAGIEETTDGIYSDMLILCKN